MSNVFFLTAPKSFDFVYLSFGPAGESEASRVTWGHIRSLLRDASNIALHHVLPPDRVSSQVDCNSRTFYPTGLPKCCGSEHRQSAAKCHQDSVPSVFMAPRSDSVVASVISTADFRWSIVLDVTTEAPSVTSATDSTSQHALHPHCGFGITVPYFEAMLGEVSTLDPRNLERRRPRRAQ